MSRLFKQTGPLSRQIFLSFLLTALTPAIVLSVFAYLAINQHFKENVNRQVYSESRNLGLTLFDRFESMESNLNYLSSNLEEDMEFEQLDWVTRMFSGLYIYEQGEVKKLLYGDFYAGFDLDAANRRHMQERALLVLTSSGQLYHFLMVTPLANGEDRFLVAVLDNDYLWNLTIREADFFCMSAYPGQVLFCSGAAIQQHTASIAALTAQQLEKNDYYEAAFNDIDYVGNKWELFIQPQFGLRQLDIYYFMPQKDAFIGYGFFGQILPQSMATILLLVYLLASIQVRRSLDPLSKLTKAAKRIANGRFGTKVEIETNNEFETLGEAFNDMSTRVQGHLTELQTLAKLDRLILSKPDKQYIIEILLDYIPQVIPLQNLAILMFDASSIYVGTLFYRKQGSISLQRTNLILNEDEYGEIENTLGMLIKDKHCQHNYLGTLKKLDSQKFLVVPIRTREAMLGAILVGLADEEIDITEYQQTVPPLAERAAVAFSNADWEKKLFNQAHYDDLTGLPNRFLFKDRFEQALERAKRSDVRVSLLFLDLDRFKSINDSLGHEIGDILLQEVAKRFLQCVRAYDSVARFGGDEFVIVLSDVEPDHIHEQSVKMAERVIKSLKQPIVIEEREFFVSPSIGIAIYPQDGRNYDEMLKQADTAMYEAKKISSASYHFYDNSSNIEPLQKLELENELRQALANNQLTLNYQPKVDLTTGKISDVEALLRWEHPKKGVIKPEAFVPLAEEAGLITEIGYWVLRESCLQSKHWDEQGVHLNIALNISSDQFRQQHFYETVVNILEETGVNPHKLEMEITESIYIDNHEKTTGLLNDLKELGIGICMDDFGTGYSSMTYLQHIPVDKLKIDKSFVDNIHSDKGQSSIVKAIITLAHSLDLRVVAEGVETHEQYAYLNEVSCDEAQGYYICYPLPADEVADFILQANAKTVTPQS